MLNKLKGGKSVGFILLFVFMVFVIFLSNLMSLPYWNHPDGELGCSSLTDCTGKASCNEKGTAVGCTITCKGGAIITCPSTWKENYHSFVF